MPDSIDATEQRFQQVAESLLPTPESGPLREAVQETRGLRAADRAMNNPDDRRRYLLAQLQSANNRQSKAIIAELHSLDQADRLGLAQQHLGFSQERFLQHERDIEANQRRMMAHDAAAEADRQWKIDRETEIDEHGAAMIHGLGVLRGALR